MAGEAAPAAWPPVAPTTGSTTHEQTARRGDELDDLPTRTHERAGSEPGVHGHLTDVPTTPKNAPDPFDIKTAVAGGTAHAPASSAMTRRSVLLLAGGAALALVVVVVAIVVAVTPSAPPPIVSVVSVPPGAEVRLDGQVMGATPVAIDLQRRGVPSDTPHRVEVSLPGYETWARTLVTTGDRQEQIAVLTPRRATLRVQSRPTGAHVWIDGVLFGTTPLGIPGLAVGRQLHVRAAKTGEGEAETTVTITTEDMEPRIVLELVSEPVDSE